MREFYDDSSNNNKLKYFLNILPLDTVEYACAYGSGAVSQDDDDTSGKMIDFIIATRDSSQFHKQNCVIDVDDLLLDLIDWRWMYLAGRLQKHVVDLVGPSPRISFAMKKNRLSASQAALLLLPDKFILPQFYNEIISLSYRGDFRMLFGEDKNKIRRIAEGSKTQLNQIYVPLLKADKDVSIQGCIIEQDRCSAVFFKRILELPFNVLWNLQRKTNSRNGTQNDIEEIAASLARRMDGPKPVAVAIKDIVRRSALQQTAKNMFSAEEWY